MWEALQNAGWVDRIADTGWLYAAVSITHYFALFLFIGTVAILDLRILGVADARRSLVEVARQLAPWNWLVWAIAIFSGFVLFATGATEYVPVTLFWVKMGVVAVASIVSLIVQSRVSIWSRVPVAPPGARFLAFLSLLLWIGAILAAVDISYIAGVG